MPASKMSTLIKHAYLQRSADQTNLDKAHEVLVKGPEAYQADLGRPINDYIVAMATRDIWTRVSTEYEKSVTMKWQGNVVGLPVIDQRFLYALAKVSAEVTADNALALSFAESDGSMVGRALWEARHDTIALWLAQIGLPAEKAFEELAKKLPFAAKVLH